MFYLFIQLLTPVVMALQFQIAVPDESKVTASSFFAETDSMSYRAREEIIAGYLELGHVPDFLREAQPVTFQQTLADGKIYQVQLWVSRDYVAIGTQADWVRIPMTYKTAARLARQWHAFPPTAKIVRLIYFAAEERLFALTQTPDDNTMRSNAVIMEHHQRIEDSREDVHVFGLQAGHKKDYVLSNRLLERPNREAIYGWFRRDGMMIQPLSIVHDDGYADYSHGLRLIHQRVSINGQDFSYREILQHPKLASLLSDEGPLRNLPIFNQ